MAGTTRIIIPTNFTVHSLGLVVDVLEQHTGENLEIILVYGRYSSTSVTELFLQSKDELLEELQSEYFIKACEIIRSRFGKKIKEIYSDMMTSANLHYAKNYIKGIGADEIMIPEGYALPQIDKRGFDVSACLKKTGSPKIVYLRYADDSCFHEEEDAVSALFFRKGLNVTY